MGKSKGNFISSTSKKFFVFFIDNIKKALVLFLKNTNELTVIVIAAYIFCAFIDSTSFGINSEVFSLMYKFVKLFCYAFFALLMCFKFLRYANLKEAIYRNLNGLLYLAIGFFVFLFSRNTNFFFVVMILIAIDKKNINRIIKTVFSTVLISYISVIFLNVIGAVDTVTITRGDKLRYSLGMDYPTVTIGVLYTLVLLYCYIKKSKANISDLIVIEILSVIVFTITDGRMGIILITLVLLGMFLGRFSKVKEKCKVIISDNKVKIILCYLPFIFAFVMILLTLLYTDKNIVMKSLDKLLSGRLKYGKSAFIQYSVSLFGQKIKWMGWAENIGTYFQYNYVDCSYVRVLFDCGIVGLISLLALYSKFIRYEIQKKEYGLLFITINVLIWSIVEPYIFNLYRNTTILLMANVICDYDYNKPTYKTAFFIKKSFLKVFAKRKSLKK